MASITLPRTGGAPIVFDGAELTRGAGNIKASGASYQRWYEGAVYRASDGRYVVAFAYRTQWQGELDNRLVAVARTPAEVRAYLEREDPRPPRVGFPSRPEYAERQQELLGKLEENRRQVVSQLLDHEEFVAGLDNLSSPEEPLRERRDLARYRRLLDDAHRRLNFTEAEAALICDSLNGWGSFSLYAPDDHDHEMVFWRQSVLDSIEQDRLDAKWAVNAAQLRSKLKGLSLAKLAAVADAAERFWSSPRLNELDTRALLEESGFVLSD